MSTSVIIGRDYYHGNSIYPRVARVLAIIDASELTDKERAAYGAVHYGAAPTGMFVRLHNFGRRPGYRKSATELRVFSACYFETRDALTRNNTH